MGILIQRTQFRDTAFLIDVSHHLDWWLFLHVVLLGVFAVVLIGFVVYTTDTCTAGESYQLFLYLINKNIMYTMNIHY